MSLSSRALERETETFRFGGRFPEPEARHCRPLRSMGVWGAESLEGPDGFSYVT